MRFLCWIGLHSWAFWERWTPSMDARIVTRFEMGAVCQRCGKHEQLADDRFDAVTGVPIDAA
jgi:hypothetical protein